MSTPSARGLFAELTDVHDLVRACEEIRARGYTRWEAYAPAPDALLHRIAVPAASPVGRFALAGGVVGAALSAGLFGVDGLGGGLTLGLLAAAGAVGAAVAGFWWVVGLGRLRHPLLESGRFLAARSNRYILYIDGGDPLFDPLRTPAALEELGAAHVERPGA